LISDGLRLALSLLKVRRRAVDLGCVYIFIEAGFDTKELLVRRKLVPVPACARCAGAERDVVAVADRGDRRAVGATRTEVEADRIVCPRLQLAFATGSAADTDVDVGLESCI
jgi:hypothetical protein